MAYTDPHVSPSPVPVYPSQPVYVPQPTYAPQPNYMPQPDPAAPVVYTTPPPQYNDSNEMYIHKENW